MDEPKGARTGRRKNRMVVQNLQVSKGNHGLAVENVNVHAAGGDKGSPGVVGLDGEEFLRDGVGKDVGVLLDEGHDNLLIVLLEVLLHNVG